MALLLVVFVVTLASILVVNLTYSVFLEARLNTATEKGIAAEYVLKSALNVARVVLKNDNSNEDSEKDIWAIFARGAPVPPEWLGMNEPNVVVTLELRPESSKMSIKPAQGNDVNTARRDALVKLFQLLQFDDDNDPQPFGPFAGKVFNSKDMVANLIDYIDADKESYAEGDFRGVDAEMPEGVFPNVGNIMYLNELQLIPGFTPARVERLIPFVTTYGSEKVNINFAPLFVLQSLDPDLDESLAQALIDFRTSGNGPFEVSNLTNQLRTVLGNDDLADRLPSRVTTTSDWFQVIAKVDYGVSNYFLRAYLVRNATKELPKIKWVELF